jgi:hypothetical protein
MAQIAHPQTGDSIEVKVIDEASHHGEYVQVQAVEDDVELSDQSGEAPWIEADELMFPEQGMAETPEDAVALADGRTPEEAEEMREEVEA